MEVSEDAMLLITTSWQAANRLKHGDKNHILCDSLVTLSFLGFYLEASLDYIIIKMGREMEVEEFYKPRKIGLQYKLAWFYNEFIVISKSNNYDEMKKNKKIFTDIEKEFPGFGSIRDFRNDISHGGNLNDAIVRIKRDYGTFEEIDQLRTQAKAIVGKLCNIAEENGYDVKKIINYDDAITKYN